MQCARDGNIKTQMIVLNASVVYLLKSQTNDPEIVERLLTQIQSMHTHAYSDRVCISQLEFTTHTSWNNILNASDPSFGRDF